ncbi:hypothetical protein JW721_00290 [Candidatus Micrarchaeota archaeon]|nr:hypothetical protein [Candidatus Micrarchaeota archaeon]
MAGVIGAAIGYGYYKLTGDIDARNEARTQELMRKLDEFEAELAGPEGSIARRFEEIEQRQYERAIMIEDLKENLAQQMQGLLEKIDEVERVRGGGKAKEIVRCPEGGECK